MPGAGIILSLPGTVSNLFSGVWVVDGFCCVSGRHG